MAYLIPSSIFKTVFGVNLRVYMKPYIEFIRDFTQVKMFDDALVKSAIMVLNAKRKENVLQYTDVTMQKNVEIQISSLGDKWFFTESSEWGKRRFGDYFKVSHVVATLLNKAYVLKEGDYLETEKYYQSKNCNIEKAIVKDTATPRSLRYNKIEKIIFPYYYENGQLNRYDPKQFEQLFPGAVEYLNIYREGLDNRQKDEKSEWFEYGRSQALSNLNVEKLLVSTVITNEVVLYRVSAECIPYAGMYIVARESNKEITLDDAMNILQDENFMKYVLDVGIHISGSSLRITSKDIENFRF